MVLPPCENESVRRFKHGTRYPSQVEPPVNVELAILHQNYCMNQQGWYAVQWQDSSSSVGEFTDNFPVFIVNNSVPAGSQAWCE